MADDAKTPSQLTTDRVEKLVRLGLVASLGLNIFLGGFVAARMLGPKPPQDAPEIIGMNLRGLPQGLSSEVREKLEDSMREHRREIRRAYGDYRDQQREINQLLREEQLNEKAVARAYEQLRRLNAEIQGPMQRALVDAIRKMDVDSRRQIIDLREIPTVRRFGRPESVDGTRWRFDWKDEDGFQLRMDHDGHMTMEVSPEMVFEEPPEEPSAPEDEGD